MNIGFKNCVMIMNISFKNSGLIINISFKTFLLTKKIHHCNIDIYLVPL